MDLRTLALPGPAPRPLLRLVVAVSVACALAACGTTVQTAGTAGQATGTDGTTGLVQPGGEAGAPTVPGTTQQGLTPGQSSTGVVVGTGGTTGSATGSTTGRPAAPTLGSAKGRGFTATTIEIGVGTTDDANAYIKALGFDNLNTGDGFAQYNAVVADINKHGGIAGRRIVLVRHDYNTAEYLNDPENANEAACATWTQDHHVFAVALPGGIVTDNLLECLKKADTPLIYGGGVDAPRVYRATYERYPDFFNPGSILGDRFDEISIERLVKRGFFKGWDTLNGRPGTAPMKLGANFGDSVAGDTKKKSVERQLAKYGIKISSVVRCPTDISTTISCQQSAVLRMQADGVTHMLGVGVFFLTTAEGQHYRPRYIIDQTAKTYASVVPHQQLNGAMSESVVPLMDVEQPQDPGDPSPATGRCRKVMRAAGQDTTDRTTMWSMGSVCDALYFLRAAVQAGGVLSTLGVRQGFEALGRSVPSALTWTSVFGPGEHASTRGVRDLAFHPESCDGCADGYFTYVDKVTHTS